MELAMIGLGRMGSTFDDEKEQFAVAALLRPGNASDRLGARGLLRRLLNKLRVAFPRARFRVRLDSGFAGGRPGSTRIRRECTLRPFDSSNEIIESL